ncbi:MAG TPA: hypothetical protein VFL59_15295 [Candidatus Nanopelagicales bacterium]|nr:hypothetical protein [Candidatus Nanopelagicales bacterium]
MRYGAALRHPGRILPRGLALLVCLVAVGCSTTSPSPSPTPSSPSPTTASSTPAPSSASPTTPSASSASPSLTGFAASVVTGGTTWPGQAQAQLVRVAVGTHDGYDRVVLEFAAGPVPAYEVVPQAHPTFRRDPSDLPVALQGDTGVRVVVRGSVVAGAAAHLLPGCPAVREVELIGSFEGVVSYGVGVAGVARVRVTTLSSPARLVIDVLAP